MKITERQASKLSRKVHEALGAASVRCDPAPDELLVVERGLEIGANLMREIQEILGLEVERHIDDEKVKADKKGNKPMDEEFFTEETVNRLTIPEGASPRNSEYYESLVVDIETYTEHALKLQMAVFEAESQLEDACQKQREAETAVDDARAKLREHLNIIRGTHVTLRGGRHE